MLEIIRLSGFLARVPLQEKLPLLEHLHEMGDFYSVKELCEALEVARGTFYNHIFRRADPQKYQDEKIQLILKIKQIFDDSEQRYGAGKIRAVLAGTGQQVSTKRVSSIMQALGLQSVRTDAKKFYIKLQHRKKRNLLQRHFTADRPIRYGAAISPILKSTIPEYIFELSSTCFPAGLWDIVYPIPPAPILSRPLSGKLMRNAAIPQS